MPTTTIRVSERTHEALRAMSASTGESMSRLLERAVDRLRAEEFFSALDAAYDALRAEPSTWAEEQAERATWEATLADGLDEDED